MPVRLRCVLPWRGPRMTSESIASRVRPRRLLATPGYARLWFAGGVGSAMRWVEMLVAGIFTYDATHSTLLVAVVVAARSLPMLFLGPILGVIGEAFNRKRLLFAQQTVMATNSVVLAMLALTGQIRVWHVALGGAVAGIGWASEMAVRRRMIGEVVTADRVGAAVAFDTLTNSLARVLGPVAGGAAFEVLGLGGAYLLSAGFYLAAGIVVLGLKLHQEPRRLRLGRIPGEIIEGLAVARASPAILGVVFVTIIMNTFGFCYSALIAPIGLDHYRVSPTLVGALASAEPIGAIAVGTAMSLGWLHLYGNRVLLQGSFLALGTIILMALSPWYGLAFGLLLIGGCGTAAFGNMQTALVLIEAPPATRSRVMGIVTMCIGTGPLGVLLIGALAQHLGPEAAILIMAGIGLAGLSLVWRKLIQRPAPTKTLSRNAGEGGPGP
jgi:MFS family permease